MTYLNRRTGAKVDAPCRLEGPDWEEVTEAEPAKKADAPKAAPKRKTAKKGADA